MNLLEITINMKYFRNIFKLTACLITVTILISACNKFKDIKVPYEGTIYMPQALDEKSSMDLILSDIEEKIVFGAAYSGLLYPKQDIPLVFELQNNLIAAYNLANGTDYLPLPESAYTISGLSTVISAGKTTSTPLYMSVDSKKVSRDEKYMMPIVLVSAGNSKIDSSKKIAYFRIENVVRRETDITQLSKLTVSQDHRDGSGSGEGSPKLVDNNTATKFLIHAFPSNFWAQLTFDDAKVIGGYKLTSGNDSPERDPRDWTITASNDNTNWTVLDNVAGHTFSGRGQTQFFEYENEVAYKYYRLNISALNGNAIGQLFQLAEWRVITFK